MVSVYRIRDTQFTKENKYFRNGYTFLSKAEACRALASYHSIDCDTDPIKRMIDAGQIDGCVEYLECIYDWEFIELQLV